MGLPPFCDFRPLCMWLSPSCPQCPVRTCLTSPTLLSLDWPETVRDICVNLCAFIQLYHLTISSLYGLANDCGHVPIQNKSCITVNNNILSFPLHDLPSSRNFHIFLLHTWRYTYIYIIHFVLKYPLVFGCERLYILIHYIMLTVPASLGPRGFKH